MLTLQEISELSSIPLARLYHVINEYGQNYGQNNLQDFEDIRQSITRNDYDAFIYVLRNWQDIEQLPSGIYEDYKLYSPEN